MLVIENEFKRKRILKMLQEECFKILKLTDELESSLIKKAY